MRLIGPAGLFLSTGFLLAACGAYENSIAGPGEPMIQKTAVWAWRSAALSAALVAQASLAMLVLPAFYRRRPAHIAAGSVLGLAAAVAAVTSLALFAAASPNSTF